MAKTIRMNEFMTGAKIENAFGQKQQIGDTAAWPDKRQNQLFIRINRGNRKPVEKSRDFLIDSTFTV